MILGGPLARGIFQSARKHYTRSIHRVNLPREEKKPGDHIISEGSNLMTIQLPYSDAIIITTDIGGTEVRRLLKDNGSSYDKPFLETFSRMRIDSKNLKPCSRGLVRFTGHEIPKTRKISLPLSIREWPMISTDMVDFLVIDTTFAYDGIIGRPFQMVDSILSKSQFR